MICLRTQSSIILLGEMILKPMSMKAMGGWQEWVCGGDYWKLPGNFHLVYNTYDAYGGFLVIENPGDGPTQGAEYKVKFDIWS